MMPRKWPVTFGKGPLEKGRAFDTTRIVPGRSEHTSVPRWRPTSSQTPSVRGGTRGRTLHRASFNHRRLARMSQKTIARLERLQQLNSNRQWINHDLYRLMYREDLYIIAYERLKSKPGNMTPGTDAETLDGFSLASIREIIQEMKSERFRFKPVRQQFIPKPNGKMCKRYTNRGP